MEAVKKIIEQNPEDNWLFLPPIEDGKEMVIVWQNQEMQRLMKLYPTICFIDGTYGTDAYEHSLVVISIVTNHGHAFPVAFIWLEQEDSRHIAIALRALKEWNPDWDPRFWMLDDSDKEINALVQEFPLSRLLLCLFHRKQAWERWVKCSEKSGVPSHDKNMVIHSLEHVAEAMTEEELSKRYQDLQVKLAAYPLVLSYFERFWMPKKQMWVQCYRMVFHGSNGKMQSVDVNNYAESTNDKLKDDLEVRGDRRVDSSVTTCMAFVEKKIVAYRQDHINSQRWLNAEHKFQMPGWATGRPRNIVEALMKRMEPLDESKRPISLEVRPVNVDEGESPWGLSH